MVILWLRKDKIIWVTFITCWSQFLLNIQKFGESTFHHFVTKSNQLVDELPVIYITQILLLKYYKHQIICTFCFPSTFILKNIP